MIIRYLDPLGFRFSTACAWGVAGVLFFLLVGFQSRFYDSCFFVVAFRAQGSDPTDVTGYIA